MPSKPPGLNGAPKQKIWRHTVSAARRGYGREHRTIRAELLRDEPLCRLCKQEGIVEAAVIADHIVPLSEGGSGDRSNYQPLCKRHSDLKTAEEARRGAARHGRGGTPG